MAIIRAFAKQFCSALTSITLLSKWAITASILPLVLTRPWPTGIATECTTMTSLSRALNRALDWATFSNTDQMTSSDNWSFRLKLIPIALSYTLTSLRIVRPTISESWQFRKAYSNSSVTLAWKWDRGFESSPSAGGKSRTVSSVPVALYRLYCLIISLSIVNLGAAISSSLIDNLRFIITR